MVATAVGALDLDRARRGAWTGAAVAGAIGLLFSAVALIGQRWMGLFTTDPAIKDLGALYLYCQAAVFPFTGAGLACYFACIGLGYVTGPFLLAASRLGIAAGGGWLALQLDGGPLGLFLASSVAFVAFGSSLLAVLRVRLDR